MSKENARKFLRNSSENPFEGMKGDLREYSDGSQYFDGDDGSTGVKYSDGSSYFDDEGGHGTKYTDGYTSYSNDDGSYGTRHSDGSFDFHDEGTEEDYSSSDGNVKVGLGGGLLIGAGIAIAGIASLFKEGKSQRCDDPPHHSSCTKSSTHSDSGTSWKSTLIKCIAIIVIVSIFVVAYLIHEHTKEILVTIDTDEVLGQPYENVVQLFTEAGFSNISIEETPDLLLEDADLTGTVATVSIDGTKVFRWYDQFPRNAKIVICYHVLKLIQAPISAKDAKGENYETVLQQFKDAGFVNIKVEAKYDLVLGWFAQYGEIAEIIINGNKKFKTDIYYRPDVEIVIVYHDYKKNAK